MVFIRRAYPRSNIYFKLLKPFGMTKNPNGCRCVRIQSVYPYQTASRQVVGLVHDLGKLLAFFGSEGQWDVVGVCFGILLVDSMLNLITGYFW